MSDIISMFSSGEKIKGSKATAIIQEIINNNVVNLTHKLSNTIGQILIVEIQNVVYSVSGEGVRFIT